MRNSDEFAREKKIKNNDFPKMSTNVEKMIS